MLGFLQNFLKEERALSRPCYKGEGSAGSKPEGIINNVFGGTTCAVFMDHLAYEMGFGS
jgi:hypothetical protein